MPMMSLGSDRFSTLVLGNDMQIPLPAHAYEPVPPLRLQMLRQPNHGPVFPGAHVFRFLPFFLMKRFSLRTCPIPAAQRNPVNSTGHSGICAQESSSAAYLHWNFTLHFSQRFFRYAVC